METINKYKYDKNDYFVNAAGAKFYKNINGMESYYHICDDINPRYMPEVFRHDTKTTLYLGESYICIDFCPICGKKLS